MNALPLQRNAQKRLWDLIKRLLLRGTVPRLWAGLSTPGFGTLIRVRLGDERAQQEYLAFFWPEVEQEARRYASRGGSREDLAGEGALALWEAAFRYDPSRHRTDLPAFVRNHVHRSVRRAYRKAMGYDQAKVVPLETMDRAPVSEDGYGAAETRFDLEQARAKLGEQERAALGEYLSLVRTGGAGPDQAAGELARRHGGTSAAWKKRLQRTRRKVQELLG